MIPGCPEQETCYSMRINSAKVQDSAMSSVLANSCLHQSYTGSPLEFADCLRALCVLADLQAVCKDHDHDAS